MIHLTTAAFFLLYKAFVQKEIKLLVTIIDVIKNPGKNFGKLKFLFYALSAIPVLYYWLPKVKVSHLRNLIHAFFGSVIVVGAMYGYALAIILSLILGALLQNKKLQLNFNMKLS